ncbi:GNAT family N-acetyltransferase [Svornostia abyssi]|uniref:GNAT family N-acetyltransferase n=1 Tax=Svornostia abyssi TaxID=2898438 RepID=A0ABY5PIX2_9ACTN|nr:GNAT family N-acetyltransferase [Parviterribacteraceae bacterium J379]
MALRRATPADATPLAAIVSEGLETYRTFAPAGWDPGAAADEAARLTELLDADSPYRGWVAEDDDGPQGFTGFLPATEAGHTVVDDPALAHLRHLFVSQRAWGTDVARALHATVLDDARAHGFTTMRLFCAAGQERARRFYEREGWSPTGLRIDKTPLGVPVVEYRRSL